MTYFVSSWTYNLNSINQQQILYIITSIAQCDLKAKVEATERKLMMACRRDRRSLVITKVPVN